MLMSGWAGLPEPPIPGNYPPGAEPFLSAIVADRADDTVRLAFADWLDENDDPNRAEFIRLQIALARIHPGYANEEIRRVAFSPADEKQFQRQRFILSEHSATWLVGFPRGASTLSANLFQRGFPTVLFTSPFEWLRYGKHLRRWVPLEGLWFEGDDRDVVELMSQPSIVGLSELSFSRIGTDELRALASSPALSTLETFRLYGRQHKGTIENPVLRALFGNSQLTNVRELRVWFDRAGDALGYSIAASPYLRNLERLELSDAMGYEAARELFNSPNLVNVTELNLSSNPIGDFGIRSLVRSKYVTRVKSLGLQEASLGTESGRLLASWPGLRSITDLSLAYNRLGVTGVRHLSESPHLSQLRWLGLNEDFTGFEQSVIRDLPGFAHIPRLQIG